MRKLIIQIPCYNEAETLPHTLNAIPKVISGFSSVEILVIDDGSNDNTSEVARQHGVHHIIRNEQNLGLGKTFQTGLRKALELGADTIVNLDADNQYHAGDVEKLTAPIVTGKCKVVIGTRPIWRMSNFSLIKKTLQTVGSKTVSQISRIKVKDVTSGFRAIHASEAGSINIYSSYSYTIEMVMQLGYRKIAIENVDINVNEKVLRPSRLIKNYRSYILASVGIMIRSFYLHHPKFVAYRRKKGHAQFEHA